MQSCLRSVAILVLLCCGGVGIAQPVAGDYRSAATGAWNASATWQKYDGSAWAVSTTWPGQSTADSGASVTIQGSHTVSLNSSSSSKNIKNLTVEPAGAVTTSDGSFQGVSRYLKIYGDLVSNKGTLGNGTDGFSLTIMNNCVISGGGVTKLGRLRPGAPGAAVTIASDVVMTYRATSGGGGGALLFTDGSSSPNPTAWFSSVTINPGVTLTFLTNSKIQQSSTQDQDWNYTCTFTVHGTIVMADTGSAITFRVPAPGMQTMIVNGVVTTRTLNPSSLSPGLNPSTLLVNAGGVLHIGTGVPGGRCDFGVPAQTVTGAGTFELGPGVDVMIGSPDGLTKTAAKGPVQTAVRSFSRGARYYYNGATDQVTGDGIPDTVAELSSYTPSILTMTKSIVVDSMLRNSSRKIVTGKNTLTINYEYGFSPSAFVEGNLRRCNLHPADHEWRVGLDTSRLIVGMNVTSSGKTGSVTVTALNRRTDPPTGAVQTQVKALTYYYRIIKDPALTPFVVDTMTFEYSMDDLKAVGGVLDSLRVYRWNVVSWQQLKTTYIHPDYHYIQVLATEPAGEFIITSGSVNPTTGVEDGTAGVPAEFAVRQNYPNPFNPATTIEYALPRDARVTLHVINTLGQEVLRLDEGMKPGGTHSVQLDASGLASGVYIYQVRAGAWTGGKKMLVVR